MGRVSEEPANPAREARERGEEAHDRAVAARARATAARERAAELASERLDETVAGARLRADRQVTRARVALARSAEGHERAAALHEQAARLDEEQGNPAGASAHRQQAVESRAAAEHDRPPSS
jgi:hypothetical protein